MTATSVEAVRGSRVIGQVVWREMASRTRASITKVGRETRPTDLQTGKRDGGGGGGGGVDDVGMLLADVTCLVVVVVVRGGGGDGSRIRVGRIFDLPPVAAPPPVNRLGNMSTVDVDVDVDVENSRAMSVSHVSGDQRRAHARTISGEPGDTYKGVGE